MDELKYWILYNKAKVIRDSSLRRLIEIDEWILQDEKERRIKTPYVLKESDTETRIRTRVSLEAAENCSYYLYVPGDLSAIVLVNDRYYYGIDKGTRYVPLDGLGNSVDIELIIPPRKFHGEKFVPNVIGKAYVVCIDETVKNFADKILWLLELARATRDADAAHDIVDSVDRVLKRIEAPVPSPSQILYGRKDLYPSYLQILYDELLCISRDNPAILTRAGYGRIEYGKWRKQVIDSMKYLEAILEELRGKYPKRGLVHAVAHSHIDVAWLWRPEDAVYKVARTLAKILTQFERRSRPKYVLTSGLFAKWMHDYYPELFGRLKKMVDANRVLLVGGMYVETDTMITPSEALARQLIYGQRMYEEFFGRKTRIGWLPDSFGYSANLPQLLREAGIRFFVIHKVEWNKYNRFPYHTFMWRGIDGTEVYTHVLLGTYSQKCSARSFIEAWEKYDERHLVPRFIYAYGYGDGGGGPTEEMYDKLEFYGEETPLTPRLIHGGLEEFVNEVEEKRDKLPVWRGEIYVEIHRGTYTTNTCIKKLVWLADYYARLLEQLLTWRYLRGGEYDNRMMDEVWEYILLSCFHDVLPGSSTNEVYREICSGLMEKITGMRDMASRILRELTGGRQGIIVYNPIQWDRAEIIELDPRYSKIIEPSQMSHDSRPLIRVKVPGNGYTLIPPGYMGEPIDDQTRAYVCGDNICMENKYLRIVIDRRGRIVSMYDKEIDREVLEKPSGIIMVYEDIPHSWDAWDIDEYTLENGRVLDASSINIVEDGPLRSMARITYNDEDLSMDQYIVMYSGSRRIDFRASIRPFKRRRLVKAWFYPDVNAFYSWADTPYGVVSRPTSRNTSWERARFEVPMLSWTALEDGGHGFAVISPVKHGASIEFNRIGLSLFRTPMYPDPLSDSGDVSFTYSIMPYMGTWVEAGVHVEAEKLANPLFIAYMEKGEKASRPISERLLHVKSKNVVLKTVKKADKRDSIILRMAEIGNIKGELSIELGFPAGSAWRTNILEERIRKASVTDNIVRYKYRPYEIITLEIQRRDL